MASFYADENFEREIVDALLGLGHDVLTALQAGNANRRIPDSDVLAYAISTNRIVLSQNRRDFLRLHGRNPSHYGMILCTFDFDYRGLAERIHSAIRESADLSGRVIRIVRPNAKVSLI